jgi:hypothetical protein
VAGFLLPLRLDRGEGRGEVSILRLSQLRLGQCRTGAVVGAEDLGHALECRLELRVVPLPTGEMQHDGKDGFHSVPVTKDMAVWAAAVTLAIVVGMAGITLTVTLRRSKPKVNIEAHRTKRQRELDEEKLLKLEALRQADL